MKKYMVSNRGPQQPSHPSNACVCVCVCSFIVGNSDPPAGWEYSTQQCSGLRKPWFRGSRSTSLFSPLAATAVVTKFRKSCV